MTRLTWIVGFVALCSSMTSGAAGPSPELVERMKPAQFLVGEWQGEGFMQMGPERVRFESRESVVAELGGELLRIEGVHFGLEGEMAGKTVHHAIALLHWDPRQEGLRFRSYVAGGRWGDFPAAFEEGALVWRIPEAGIRYTTRLDAEGRWSEVGERSTDGQNWQRFFEMTLRRVAKPAS